MSLPSVFLLTKKKETKQLWFKHDLRGYCYKDNKSAVYQIDSREVKTTLVVIKNNVNSHVCSLVKSKP